MSDKEPALSPFTKKEAAPILASQYDQWVAPASATYVSSDLTPERVVERHNDNVDHRDRKLVAAGESQVKAGDAREDMADTMSSTRYVSKPLRAQLQAPIDDANREFSQNVQEARVADDRRKATLWDAKEHFEANPDAYRDVAIEEAQVAGKEIVQPPQPGVNPDQSSNQ